MHNINTVLDIRKGLIPKDPNPDIFDVLWGKKLAGSKYKILTILGNPLSFITKKAQTAISTKISMEPIQEGSGDPSPENIRPISGRTQVNLNGCGKNLFDGKIYQVDSYISQNGAISSNSSYNIYKIDNKQNSYVLSFVDIISTTNTLSVYANFYNANDELLSTNRIIRYSTPSEDRHEGTITFPQNCSYALYCLRTSTRNTQIELGSTATSYEPYAKSNEITISFGQTVYGGTLDVEKGELTVNREILTLNGSEDWQTSSGGNTKYFSLRVGTGRYTSNVGFICDTYPTASITTSSTDVGCNTAYSTAWANSQLRFRPENVSSMAVNEWKSLLTNNPVTVCYRLYTPTTISLTPEEVQLLKGANTLWTDGNNIELTYKA